MKIGIGLIIAGGLAFGLLGAKPEVRIDKPNPETYVVPKWVSVPDYPFLRTDLNQIEFYGDTANFTAIFDQLDQLIFEGEGNLNIMHIGGSHVQGGSLSNRMRENLQSLGHGLRGPRGFVFPYRLAHTNGPSNLKVRYTGNWDGFKCSHRKHNEFWGLSGYVAETRDTLASLKVWSMASDSTNYLFNRVRVFHSMNTSSYDVQLDSGLTTTSYWNDTMAYFTEFQLDNWYDTLWLKVIKTDSLQDHFEMRGIELDNDQPGITYHAVGVNGASVPSYLRCDNLETELAVIQPDLVIFGIGINDAYGPESRFSQRDFEANYDTLITRIKRVNPDCAFLFLSNNDSYYKRRYANRNAIKVRDGMINLAKKHGGGFWDLFNIMGGLNSIKAWENAGLAKRDKIHFTSSGYVLQADMMHEAFREAYGNHLEWKFGNQN